MSVQSGTDRHYVFVTEDAHTCEITALITRDTPGGRVSDVDKISVLIGPGAGEDPRTRLKDALIALVEYL